MSIVGCEVLISVCCSFFVVCYCPLFCWLLIGVARGCSQLLFVICLMFAFYFGCSFVVGSLLRVGVCSLVIDVCCCLFVICLFFVVRWCCTSMRFCLLVFVDCCSLLRFACCSLSVLCVGCWSLCVCLLFVYCWVVVVYCVMVVV